MGNDMNADQNDLVIITGANQGGKSTFLRSIHIVAHDFLCHAQSETDIVQAVKGPLALSGPCTGLESTQALPLG